MLSYIPWKTCDGMLAKKKKKTFQFNYWQDTCAACRNRIKDIEDFEPSDYEKEDLKEAAKQYNEAYKENKNTQTWGTHIVQTGTVTFRQAGYLCSTCKKKRTTSRIRKIEESTPNPEKG